MASTDLQLLRQYADAGDAEAFAELVARHRNMVYGTCHRVLPNPADAEDAAQECFLRLASHGGSIKTSVAGWLHRVAVHISVSAQRRDRTRKKTEWTAAATLTEGSEEDSWRRIKAEIDRAIDRLPDRLREPLVLHFLEGRPQTVIAEELGVSQSSVSRWIKEGVEKLRRHLAKTGLLVSAAGLAGALEVQVAEAAPPALVAELGKIGLAGIGSSSSGAGAGSALGLGLITGANAKIACVAATALTVAAVVQYTAQEHGVPRQPATTLQSATAHHTPVAALEEHVPAAPTRDADDRTPAPQDRAPARTTPTENRVSASTSAREHGKRVVVRPTVRGVDTASKPATDEAEAAVPNKLPSSARAAVMAPSPPAEKGPGSSPATGVLQTPEGAGPEAAAEQDAVAESPDPDTTASLAALAPQNLRFFFNQPRQQALPDLEGVWIDLRQGEDAHGLQWLDEWQCSRKMGEVGGVQCAQTDPLAEGLYLLFETHWDMIVPDRDTLTFEVEYFDSGPFPLVLQVESVLPTVAGAEVYWRGAPTRWREGTNTWRRARWQVTDEAFCDIARDKIRFRLYDEGWRRDRTLSVCYVHVTHEALRFRPESEVLLCNQQVSVTIEAYDPAGEPLPDGTEVALSCEPEDGLAALPDSVTLIGGKATFDLQAGTAPGTVWLTARTETMSEALPLHVLAGEGEIVERTDLVLGEDLVETARFIGRRVAESTIDTFTDDQNQVALRARFIREPNAAQVRLLLDVPIAGFPKALCVYMGCPDESVETVWAEIVDRDGEVFPYALEQLGGGPLPYFAERRLDCRALPGPTWNERQWGGQGTNGIIDLPCVLRALPITPSEGFDQVAIHVWGVETEVLVPITATAQATASVAGQVLGPDGQPVNGATVVVQYTGPDERYATQRGTTDADGGFALEFQLSRWERLVRIAAQKPGLALDWRTVKPGDTVTLELGAEPATFSGVVTDTDGNPIAGAEAHIHALWRPPDDPVVQETAARYADTQDVVWTWFYPHDSTLLATTSDEIGRFEIHGLPPNHEVRVTVRAPGHERLRMTRDEVPANTRDFEAVLGPEAVIAGRVMHDGRPVGGIEVDCRSRGPGEGSAMTAEDGTFTVGELGPGTYDIHVHEPEGLVGAWGGPVRLLPGGRATGVEVALTPGAMIEGTVTDSEAGEPIEGAPVFASADRYDGYARSDERGRYAIRVPAGRYEIRCYSPYGPRYPRTDPANHSIEVAEGEAKTDLNFTAWPINKTVLRGRVVDVDGQPVPSAEVGGPSGVRVISGTYEGYFPATCDAQGRFELEIRSDETQRHDWPVLAIEPERGLAGLAMVPQVLPEGPVEIEVGRGGRVTGVVEDADTKPLPGIPIRLGLLPRGHGVQYWMYAATTDERGAFSIGPLPTGARYSGSLGGQYGELVVSDRRMSGELAPGEHVQLEPIVVNVAGRSLAGWAMDAGERPVQNALVCVSGLDDPVRSDADGRFELTGLPTRGKLWVVAVHPTQPLCAAEQVDPDWELEPGLILQETGSAEGRVVDQAGRPVAGVTLKGWPQFLIEYPEGGGSARGLNWVFGVGLRVRGSDDALVATTDADGRWRAEGLIGGARYHFSVEADHDRRGSGELTAIPGKTVDVGDIKLRPHED